MGWPRRGSAKEKFGRSHCPGEGMSTDGCEVKMGEGAQNVWPAC